MTVVVLGIDALDPEVVDPADHPNLVLEEYAAIGTIASSAGEPSTHELWPSIITGLPPAEHGLQLDDGVAWENPILAIGSTIADSLLPDELQNRIGAWLLTHTGADAFRVPATYYEENDIETIFDDRQAAVIGVPNYVTDPDEEDREHRLRREMGTLFERDPNAAGGHRSDDPGEFYELCLEMSMIRVALVRRALRSKRHELVFGYTSGLDLVGHIAYDLPALQARAYDELDDFVGELRRDLNGTDDLVLVSDHGLQDGVHTHQAMIASTSPEIVDDVEDVLDIREALDTELNSRDHVPEPLTYEVEKRRNDDTVKKQLEDLGYM